MGFLRFIFGVVKAVVGIIALLLVVMMFLSAVGCAPSIPRETTATPVVFSTALDMASSTVAPGLSADERLDRMTRATVMIRLPKSLGSGVVIDNQKCLVVTNEHVVHDDGDINVFYIAGYRADGSSIVESTPGKVLGVPSGHDDLALVQMDKCPGLPWASLGDSRKLKAAQQVIAIGMPEAELWSVTKGIVSRPDRFWNDGHTLGSGFPLVQTDAAINHGNSGGPLYDMAGYVVGINSMGFDDANNMGYARSSWLVAVYLKNLAQYGQMPDIDTGMDLTALTSDGSVDVEQPSAQVTADYPGLKVTGVDADSPAAKAGVQKGDVLLKLGDIRLYSVHQLVRDLRLGGPGTYSLAVLRDNQVALLKLTIPAPSPAPAAVPAS